jgi:hypothetical protein
MPEALAGVDEHAVRNPARLPLILRARLPLMQSVTLGLLSTRLQVRPLHGPPSDPRSRARPPGGHSRARRLQAGPARRRRPPSGVKCSLALPHGIPPDAEAHSAGQSCEGHPRLTPVGLGCIRKFAFHRGKAPTRAYLSHLMRPCRTRLTFRNTCERARLRLRAASRRVKPRAPVVAGLSKREVPSHE